TESKGATSAAAGCVRLTLRSSVNPHADPAERRTANHPKAAGVTAWGQSLDESRVAANDPGLSSRAMEYRSRRHCRSGNEPTTADPKAATERDETRRSGHCDEPRGRGALIPRGRNRDG